MADGDDASKAAGGQPGDDPQDAQQPSGTEGGANQASEEELRAQLEEEIRKVRVEDVVLQSAVSILNLSARRIAKDDERDLDQAKLGIDAAAALADLVPEEARAQLKQAVSELQMLYTQHAGGDAGGGGSDGGDDASGGSEPPRKPDGPGLWTPGGAGD